jgi:uncharacterized protein (TIGR00369 family)
LTGPISYGVAPLAEMSAMSGRQFLEAMVRGEIPQAAICEPLSFRLTEVGEGFAVFEGEPGPHLFNPQGGVHGGWAMTMIDSAAGCAGLSLLPAGQVFTTLETKVNMTRAITATTATVRAESRVISSGRRVITCEADIRDATGRILAHGTSTLLVVPREPAPAQAATSP